MLAGNQPPKRILVRGVNWLGDAVMTTPALMRLREALPDAKIVLLTHEKLAGLWPCHPALDGLITFSPAESPWRIGRRLRAGLFDLSLVLPNSPRSALEVWLGRIPERVGYARSWRNWWLTRTVPLPAETVPMHPRSVRHVRRAIRRSQPASIPPITTAA
ncbi:MAG: glycosyltransferase family 9 protein, partial [Candidatus Omnitrophica bacterium]|nr:glycosyltransferase family 9 protein [Candidatus Omnitrophota bacterium]